MCQCSLARLWHLFEENDLYFSIDGIGFPPLSVPFPKNKTHFNFDSGSYWILNLATKNINTITHTTELFYLPEN